MALDKKPTHTVTHKRLYLSVEGKLQHVKEDSPLVLSAKQAKGLGGRVKAISSGAAKDLTEKPAAK